MMVITMQQLCDAIATTLGTAAGMTRVQSVDELTEGIHRGDTPLMQVYPEEGSCDPSGATDRTTFQGGVRQKTTLIHVDVYAHTRSHIDEDMKVTIDILDALIEVLEVQNTKPYFNLEGLKAFSWRWKRMTFRYAKTDFMGIRLYLTTWIY
jgi:hypothetical protein